MGTGFGDLLPALEALTDPTRVVGLTEAAELTGLSPSRMQRVVTAAIGESPASIDISIEELEPVPVIYEERQVDRAELGAVLAEILPAVFEYVMGEGLAPAGHPFVRHIGMSAAFVTIQAGIPLSEVPPTMPASETGLIASQLPGGPAAVTVHQGSYEQLGDAHAALDRWIAESDHTATGGPWELYLTDPGEVPDPAQWMTKICWPVA